MAEADVKQRVTDLRKDPEQGILLQIEGHPYPLRGFPATNVVDMLDIVKEPVRFLLATLEGRPHNPILGIGSVLGKYVFDLKDLDPFTRSIRQALLEVESACNNSFGQQVRALNNLVSCLISYDTSYRWLAQLTAWCWLRSLLRKHLPEEKVQEILRDVIDETDAYWIRTKSLWDADKLGVPKSSLKKEGEGRPI